MMVTPFMVGYHDRVDESAEISVDFQQGYDFAMIGFGMDMRITISLERLRKLHAAIGAALEAQPDPEAEIDAIIDEDLQSESEAMSERQAFESQEYF